MKKIITLFIFLLFVTVVAACNDKKETTKVTTQPAPQATHVSFTSWGLGSEADNNLLRRRIAQFNATHTDIQIDIVEFPGGDYNAFLATKAAAGEFPDVVMVGNVPDFVLQDYIGDIASIAKADPEWNDIPSALRDSVTYGDKVYAIPSAYHYMGYYANLDLIEQSGITAKFNDFTYTNDDFFNAIKAMKNDTKTDGTGTIGIYGTTSFVDWLPASLDTSGKVKQFVYDGNKFLLNSQVMKDALAKAAELNSYSFMAYSDQATGTKENPLPSERQTKFGDNWDGKVFRTGQMGFVWDGTWASSGLANDINGLFNYDFVGVPGSKVTATADYYGISKNAANKEAAYTVAKYLTFGEQGINDAFAIIAKAKTDESKTLAMDGLPINEKQAIVDKWMQTFPQPGIKLAYQKAKAGTLTVLMEGNKYVPGFTAARFNYNTGIDATISRPNNAAGSTLSIGDLIWDAMQGKISYSDYMTQQIEDAINYELVKAQLQMAQK